jgi:hypothetical protein
MSKAKSGGGIGSRVNVSPPVRTGSPTSDKIRPGGASQIGQQVVLTNSAAGKLVAGTMPQAPLGNERALTMKPAVHDRGSQGHHGGSHE